LLTLAAERAAPRAVARTTMKAAVFVKAGKIELQDGKERMRRLLA
jgi:hypothetical protein